ncbi:unnamed protein product, partial [Eretmochelys imbricata]
MLNYEIEYGKICLGDKSLGSTLLLGLWIIKQVEIVLRVKNLVALLSENTSPDQERDRRHGGQHVADTEADAHAKKCVGEEIMLEYQILHSLLIIAPRAEYFVEFTIKETRCSKSTPHANVSECEFLHGRHARVGFCRGKFASDTQNPDSLEISCEIYRPWSPDIYELTGT